MTPQEILEYNKRCAEFLAPNNEFVDLYHFPQFGLYVMNYGDTYYEEVFRISDMKFHSDWNWIMEVKEAIERLDGGIYTLVFQLNRCLLWNNSLGEELEPFDGSFLGETPKEAVVQAINQFLIWYNDNLKQ